MKPSSSTYDVTIGVATAADAEALASCLRSVDIAEIRAISGVAPAVALRRSYLLSTHVWAARDGTGGPIALWGVGPLSLTAGRGCPWLLASESFDRLGGRIARLSRPLLAGMREIYPSLENHVDARNHRSVRWLSWLGFTVDPPAPWGVEGRLFHRFWM